MNKKVVSTLAIVAFLALNLIPNTNVFAQEAIVLPPAGQMVPLSPAFTPAMIKGIKLHRDNPFEFDFIINQGQENLSESQLKQDSLRLVKYFLASLTIPEKDLWVNLSPYEKSRITTPALGVTEMGKDLLAQDYVLKQLTASLIYPEGKTGKEFWSKVYALAEAKYHTTNVPVNTFNKVWIVPQKAVVYENSTSQAAYVLESRLKVMLEEDYLAMHKHEPIIHPFASNDIGSQIVREIVIPELTKEVNEGQNFANLRQITNSLILAAWFKRTLKASILSKLYVDQKKMAGVDIKDKTMTERIFQQYLQAYKKGAYNYIKEDEDPSTHQMTPRKYFSGGVVERFVLGDNLFVKSDVSAEQLNSTGNMAMTVALENTIQDGTLDFPQSMEESLKQRNNQLLYGPVEGPKGLPEKLSAYIQDRLGYHFTPQQVLVSPSVDYVFTLLSRIVKGRGKRIREFSTDQIKDFDAFMAAIRGTKPVLIRLKQGHWDKKLMYQIWQFCKAKENQALLFIEEDPNQTEPTEDKIEEAIQNGDTGGEFVIRYWSLSTLHREINESGFGVLMTHNEDLMSAYTSCVKNGGYMNLDVLVSDFLLKILPDVHTPANPQFIKTAFGIPFLRKGKHLTLGAIYANGATFVKDEAEPTHVGAVSYPFNPWSEQAYIEGAEGRLGTRQELEGIAEDAVLNYLKETRGLNYDQEDVRLGMGLKPLLTDTIVTIVEKNRAEGHETTFILPIPCWDSYFQEISIAGAKVVPIREQDINEKFLKELTAKILRNNPKTRLANIVSDPNNPSGHIFTMRQLRAIARSALQNNSWILADEIYSEMIMPNTRAKFTSIATLDLPPNKEGKTIQDLTIVFVGLSKTSKVSGLRIGAAISSGLKELKSSTQPTMGALGVLVAEYGDIPRYLQAAQSLAKAIWESSKEIRGVYRKYGIPYRIPKGSIYIYADFSVLKGKKWTDPQSPRKVTIGRKMFFGADGLLYQQTKIGMIFFDHQVPWSMRLCMGHTRIAGETPRKMERFLLALGLKPTTDKAVIANKIKGVQLDPGGIDLNTQQMDFQIKHGDSAMTIPIDLKNLQHIQINGLSPRIIKEMDIINLSAFLGVQ